MAAAVGVSSEPGRRAAQRVSRRIGEGVEGFSQVGWRIHDDLLQHDHRRGACFPGRIPRDLELPDHLDDTVPGFGGRGRLARQHGPGGALGIDGVGLADGAARVPVPPIHFDDMMPRAADRAGQAGAIAAGALDAKRLDPPVGVGPRDQRPIPARVGDEGLIAEADPSGVDRHRDVDILVGVNADDYRLGEVYCPRYPAERVSSRLCASAADSWVVDACRSRYAAQSSMSRRRRANRSERA